MTGTPLPPAPLPLVSELVVRTCSDWHVGSGAGIAGDLDATVRRDPDGLPYVPGTSLTGLLRDSCRVVAHALDDGLADGPWQRWHTAVFGTAPDVATDRSTRWIRPALVGIGAGRLRPGLAARLVSSDKTWIATTRRPGVAIDARSGRALDGALRMVEVARGGVDLVSEVTVEPVGVHLDQDAMVAVSALLVLGAAWTNQLGGWRRRGLGEVTLTLDDQNPARWAGWLAESSWSPQEVPVPDRTTQAAPRPTGRGGGGGWHRIELRLTTTGPVRVPSQVTGNVVRGLDYLPGSLLLPWLSQRWGAERVRAAIWQRALVARTTLPEVAGQRGLPAPLTLHRSRDGDERDLFQGAPPDGARQVRSTYTDGAVTGEQVRLVPVRLATVSHNAVNPRTQRPDSESGLYELEVIPAGTVLRGEILVQAGLLTDLEGEFGEHPWSLLAGAARFGARRRGEYGATTVEVRGCKPVPSVPLPGARCQLWAVSDVVVRGRGLRYSADPDDVARSLSRELGVRVVPAGAVTRTRRRDGWHGGWQLPRESVLGLAAGSVLTVEFPDGPPPADRWAAVLAGGVGDRVAEGYGEVIADAPLLTVEKARVAADEDPPTDIDAAVPDLHPADEASLAMLSTAWLTEQVRFALPDTRTSTEYTGLRAAMAALSPSQRGTWRAAAVSAAVAGTLGPLRTQAARTEASGRAVKEPQRDVAAAVRRLTDRTGTWWAVLAAALPGTSDLTDRDRAVAAAVLVTDVLDDLHRTGEPT